MKRFREKVKKHVRTQMRYAIKDDVLDGLIQTACRGGTPAYPAISKEAFIFQYIEQLLLLEKPRIMQDIVMAASVEDPYHPDALRNLLLPAIKVMQELEKLGAAINAKVDLLTQHKENPVLMDIFKYSYDVSLAYSIGPAFKVDMTSVSTDGAVATHWWATFIELLVEFAGKPAVNAHDKQRLTDALQGMPVLARKWAMRVLRKDLKIGMKDGNIRRVWPQLLPVFNVTLCDTVSRGDGLSAALDTLPARLWVEPKYDGLRCLVWVDDAQKGHGRVYSRKGLVHEHLQYLVAEACQLLKAVNMVSGVLDCEAVNANSTRYSDAVSAQTTHGDGPRALRLMAFDVVSLNGFRSGVEPGHQHVRRTLLEQMFESAARKAPSFMLTPGKAVGKKNRAEKVMAAYATWREEGYEGVVIKDIDTEYRAGERNRKRSGYYRIKPFETVDVTITGTFPGKPGTKYEGMLGGFHCTLEDGTAIRVGGGLSDVQRVEWWEIRKQLVGRTIEIAQQENTPGIKSRHPSFVRLIETHDK